MVMWSRGGGLGGIAGEKMLQALGLRGETLAQAMTTNLLYQDSITDMLDALGSAYGDKESVRRQIVEIDRKIASVLEGVLTNNGQIVAALSVDEPQVGMMNQRLFKQMALQIYRSQNNDVPSKSRTSTPAVREQYTRTSNSG